MTIGLISQTRFPNNLLPCGSVAKIWDMFVAVTWTHVVVSPDKMTWTFKFKPGNSNVSDSFHWRFAMGRFLCFLYSLIRYYLWALRWEEKGLSLLVTLHQPMWCLLAGSSITDLEYSYSRGKAIKIWREALEGTYSRREEKGARLSVW